MVNTSVTPTSFLFIYSSYFGLEIVFVDPPTIMVNGSVTCVLFHKGVPTSSAQIPRRTGYLYR